MSYSRANPSPRYLALIELYRTMHLEGEKFIGMKPENTFPGKSLLPQIHRIKNLVERTEAHTILDYGSGKGRQYDARPMVDLQGAEFPGVLDYWDVDEVTCYDPSYPPYSKQPVGCFDGVIATDVLEHCTEEDLPWIIEELFGYASRFVFASVACYPAKKHLPSGENAHCTVRPTAWWRTLIEPIAARYPQVIWEVWAQSRIETPDGTNEIHERLGSEQRARA